jgi:hypothetical protein
VVGVVGVGVWGGFPLRSNIPRSALCATLDTYNLNNLIFLYPKPDKNRPKNTLCNAQKT